MWSPLQVNHSQKFLLQPRVSVCTHPPPYRFVFLLLCFTVWWDWLNLEKKKTKTKPQTLIPQSPQFLEACQGEHILKWDLLHILVTWQISQVSHPDWTDGEAACLGKSLGFSRCVSPSSEWLFLYHLLRHSQAQTSVLAHYLPEYKIPLSAAPLAPCVVSGSSSSLVASWGHPMPPIFNPPVP